MVMSKSTVAAPDEQDLAQLVWKAQEYLRVHLAPMGPSKADTIQRLVELLLNDHQRIEPHHADLCPLCAAAGAALAQTAAAGARP
jgi:hypothetical protein